MKDRELTKLRLSRIGFVFQSYNLINSLSALENVVLPMVYSRKSGSERQERAKELLKEVGLENRMNHHPTQLSGGQQQRVAIARAMANDPDLILADEPTGNLDSQSSDAILKLLKNLQDKGATLVIVTHEDHISQIAQRQIVVKDGKTLPPKKQNKVEVK
jgi:putative ABC transport system ATP-binding protein